ncbi:MAG: sporulation transcription factor Spo0A [Oscillospiraceae bacterium]|nr:sporulation transcription factor Spo0A [Oscillospiraceae bacterium]
MQKKLKVLIGDNTPNFGLLCQDLLTRRGMEVILTPKDGGMVLEAIREQAPDIAVMESFMAKMDAISVLKSLNQSLQPKPKIIVISGYDNKFIEGEIMQNGASYYMLKPFELESLCDRIRSVCSNGEIIAPININGADEATDDLETIVTEVILHVGIPAHIKGYHYIREAILLSVDNTEMINSVTKLLYPTIAKRFNTTSSRVERAIRHAIEIAWDRGDVDTLNAYFGYTINTGRGKPTNSEFIAMISDKLRLKLKNRKGSAAHF